MRLYGRDAEQSTIERLLQRARSGRSGVLVLRGEAGIGKSALLEVAEGAATDMRVLRGTGIERESGMPYAGLHLLLRKYLDRIDALPEGQARALRGALNLGTGDETRGDRFLVGLAVLTLLSDLAEERPLLCLIDDAHWLDPATAEALLFVARRLEAEAIVLLLAVRDPDAPEFTAEGLPELRVGALDKDAAADLLNARAAELPGHVQSEILVAAMGNPLALLELPTAHASAEPSTTYTRLQRTFADRVAALPEQTQLLVLMAAIDDQGDLSMILPAAERFGASVADLEPAERDRLVRTGEGRLEFRHPLIRTAVYGEATLSRRLSAHSALAEVYRAGGDRCHFAWHLASATTGLDEKTAAVLEETAELERDGGGHASVAAMYERAAMLSPDPGERGRRLSVAAKAAADAGMSEQAISLAERATADVTDPLARADLVLLRAGLADEQDRTKEAHRLLSGTAESVVGLNAQTAGYLFFQAGSAAANAGDFALLDRTAARAEELGVPNASLVRALARAFAGLNPGGHGDTADGVAALRELMGSRNDCLGPRDAVRTVMWHLMIGDLDGGLEAAAELERRYRREGALGLLSLVLMPLARLQLMLGHTRDALTTATEGMRIAADTGQHRIRIYQATTLAQLAAMQGDEQRCEELTTEALARGLPPSNVHAATARSLLDLGLGRHEASLNRLAGVVAGTSRAGVIAALPDLVEAAVRVGQPERAHEAARWHQDWAMQAGQPWARAIAARCAALLAPDDKAEALYEEAVHLHLQGGPPFEHARTELLYGEWLRRSRHRNEARGHLRTALEIFERLGADQWSERTRTELRAAGESLGDAIPDRSDVLALLTPQELQVVRLAAAGLSNREIGAQLFLSPRTVGYHLYKAYPKLGVASRNELSRLEPAKT
ncbi:LuxR family transcriptional regulator [Actinomadura rudentiformis]|uniref:Helix-turn-helix transcriptional regulator n=1 Tax=Actinomadura rudentiformis TaxID=359158 RepID=A0A6H9YXE8_9ACTN|nr:LuxR family transcriptional regulator [Actinomadura rudentiformis]KAB2350915.1 helix-turn-helix transcriptional regulator [Actinomadura rudentiformis]